MQITKDMNIVEVVINSESIEVFQSFGMHCLVVWLQGLKILNRVLLPMDRCSKTNGRIK